jgi:hypothetical protein
MQHHIDLEPNRPDDIYWYTDPFAGGMATVPLHDRRWYPYAIFVGSWLTVGLLTYLLWAMSRNSNGLF